MMVMDCIPLELGAPVNISFCKFHWSCFILFLFFCTFVSLLVFFSPVENQDKIVYVSLLGQLRNVQLCHVLNGSVFETRLGCPKNKKITEEMTKG